MKPLQKLKNGYTAILVKKSEDHFIVLAVSPDNNQVTIWLSDKDGNCYAGNYFIINKDFDTIQNQQMIDAIKEFNRRK